MAVGNPSSNATKMEMSAGHFDEFANTSKFRCATVASVNLSDFYNNYG
jgi:hypothetical protein